MGTNIKGALRPLVRIVRLRMMQARLHRLRRFGVAVHPTVRIYGKLIVHQSTDSKIELCESVIFNSDMKRNTLEARGANVLKTVYPGARITIGPDTGLTSVTISCASRVTVGRRVLIGAGVIITDSDHHVVAPMQVTERRHAGFPTPEVKHEVFIEDDVFIGARSIILKGVTIGRGAVVGAGSVVSKDVPAGVIAVGNPCRAVKSIESIIK